MEKANINIMAVIAKAITLVIIPEFAMECIVLSLPLDNRAKIMERLPHRKGRYTVHNVKIAMMPNIREAIANPFAGLTGGGGEMKSQGP